MGKAGLITSSIFLAGFCVGLGFASYHIALNKDAKYDYLAQLNKPEVQATLNYGTSTDFLEYAANDLGEIIIKGTEVLVNIAPDINSCYKNLSNAALNLLHSSESKNYAIQATELNKELIQLNEPEKEAQKYLNLEKKISDLKEELVLLSYKQLPKALEIKNLYESKANRQTGCIWGAVGGSIGVIACSIWVGFQGAEVSNDLSYYRNDNKRRKTRI